MEGNIIKMVKQFKYLGTEAESKGTMDAEVKKRIGTMFNFKGRNYIGYDYILKLTHILGATNMIPMHLMIHRQRLKLFGHIIRMKDDRQGETIIIGRN